MNNKGFTLVELVATIALLSVITIISFVSISGVLEKNKKSDCEKIVMTIKNAAKEYVSDNRYGTVSTSITAKYLVDNNYLKSNVTDNNGNVMFKNPFNDNYINPNSITIKIELNSDYTAKNVTIEAPLILKTCSNE